MTEIDETQQPQTIESVEADIKAAREKSLSLRAASVVSFFTTAALSTMIYVATRDPVQELLLQEPRAQQIRVDAERIGAAFEAGATPSVDEAAELASPASRATTRALYEAAIAESGTEDPIALRGNFETAAADHIVTLENAHRMAKNGLALIGAIVGFGALVSAWRGAVQWGRANRAKSVIPALKDRISQLRFEEEAAKIPHFA
ncbi:MAG: hypothetical protein GC136_03160 [Alphaproteobacteria bacterium]|nr:hypothetical protein [Alphaproteobacteria bacterium]